MVLGDFHKVIQFYQRINSVMGQGFEERAKSIPLKFLALVDQFMTFIFTFLKTCLNISIANIYMNLHYNKLGLIT